jgi:hypothetical protein
LTYLTTAELEAGLDEILKAPKDGGELKLIVCRPATGFRDVLEEGRLDLAEGLVGDNWSMRGANTPDGMPDPDMQLNIMNSRVTALVAQHLDQWKLAGDQLYIDMDLSLENLHAGTQLFLGSAIIEVTPVPHTGCEKFIARFGMDAMRFVNSKFGRQHNLRGINAKVIQPGVIKMGDVATKLRD